MGSEMCIRDRHAIDGIADHQASGVLVGELHVETPAELLEEGHAAVSYTHLTLPTSDLV